MRRHTRPDQITRLVSRINRKRTEKPQELLTQDLSAISVEDKIYKEMV